MGRVEIRCFDGSEICVSGLRKGRKEGRAELQGKLGNGGGLSSKDENKRGNNRQRE